MLIEASRKIEARRKIEASRKIEARRMANPLFEADALALPLNRNWSAIAVRDANGLFGIDIQYRRPTIAS